LVLCYCEINHLKEDFIMKNAQNKPAAMAEAVWYRKSLRIHAYQVSLAQWLHLSQM